MNQKVNPTPESAILFSLISFNLVNINTALLSFTLIRLFFSPASTRTWFQRTRVSEKGDIVFVFMPCSDLGDPIGVSLIQK